MIKKTVRFTNFNGDEVEKTFYFHWSKMEIAAMQEELQEMQKRLQGYMKNLDMAGAMREFRTILSSAVGRKSEDGNNFIKDAEAVLDFTSSPAYDEIVIQLLNDQEFQRQFIVGLVPAEFSNEVEKGIEKEIPKSPGGTLLVQEDPRPAWEREHRNPTVYEIRTMSKQQLAELTAKRLGIPADELNIQD